MTLAAGKEIGEYYWLIAAAVYGVFAWWNDRRQKKALAEEEARQKSEPPRIPQAVPTQSPPQAAPANSEEDRMRKFLEALGVPASPQSPPLRPAPQTAPKPAPAKSHRPASPTLAPRPVAAPIPRPFHRPASAPPPAPKTIPRPVVVQAPDETGMRDAGRFEEAATSFEQAMADFGRPETAAPSEVLQSIAEAATGSAPVTRVAPRFESSQGLALREMLKNRDTLRAAIIVSEVLGPPKGA